MDNLDHYRIARATDAVWEDDEHVSITVRKFGPFGSRVLEVFRLSPTATMNLDALGSDAWRLMDGRTVGEVLAALRNRYEDEPQLHDRLGLFISQLKDRKLVDLNP